MDVAKIIQIIKMYFKMLKFNFFFFSLYKLQFLKGIFLHFSVNICDTEQILFILWDSFYIKFTQQ